MNDTLNDGDVALINKVAYDFGKPDRYDVIAFEPQGRQCFRILYQEDYRTAGRNCPD